jgi:hypothetical protein
MNTIRSTNAHYPVSNQANATVVVSRVAPPVRWEYDTFLREVESHHIIRVDISQDQKVATATFADNEKKDIILPIGYDHINFLMEHDVNINVYKNETLSVFSYSDMVLFVMQIALFVIVERRKHCIPCDESCDAPSVFNANIGNNGNIGNNKNGNLFKSMSTLVALDFVNGVVKATTDTYFDISNILRIGFLVSSQYKEVDSKFFDKFFRRVRICVKRFHRKLR